MYVSVRDATLMAAGFPTLREGLRTLGLTAVELAVDRNFEVAAIEPAPDRDRLPLQTDDDVAELRRHLEDTGVSVCGFLLANDFGREDLDGEIAWVTRVVEAACALGVPVVRIDAILSGEHALSPPERQARFADAIGRVLRATDGLEVSLGIENHGRQGNDPAFLEGLLAAVNNSRLGLTLDTGNFYWAGKPLDEVHAILERLAPLAKHTHVKNIAYPETERNRVREPGWRYAEYVSPLEEGDIDLLRLREWLGDAGYEGDLCIEDESLGRFPPEQRPEILKRDVAYLERIVAR